MRLSNKLYIVLPLLFLFVSGCAPTSSPSSVSTSSMSTQEMQEKSSEIVLPVQGYEERRSFKGFGEYIQDRFVGYHAADDIEFTDVAEAVPIYAITNGEVLYVDWVSGYGGLIILSHEIGGVVHQALYGHVSLDSITLSVGDTVQKGQQIALLGEPSKEETDGERKHLHFGLHTGREMRIRGYEQTIEGLERWENPSRIFAEAGLFNGVERSIDPKVERGGEVISLSMQLPENMEVEYIPSLDAWNVYDSLGAGVARDRSEMLIRYFDATSFLTLSTVEIYETTNDVVGQGGYEARRYDIKKREGIADFTDQPQWRNQRHIVTDFHDEPGYDRYYVVAKSPDLDRSVYEEVLATMVIEE